MTLPGKYKKSITITVALAMMLLSFASCFDRNREREKIMKVWTAYRAAFSNNMGAECSRYIDSASIRYYSHILSLVKNADSTTVERLRMDQKLAVLLTRHTTPTAVVMKMDGKALFEQLVVTGVGGGSNEKLDFEFLSVNPKEAVAEVIDSNGKRGLTLNFSREFGEWKINIAKLTGQIGKFDWNTLVKESGKSEREFVYLVLEMANNVKPANAVWHPLSH
jgi:hypothetical protein